MFLPRVHGLRILLLKFRHIGDVLLATPLIDNLRRHFPDARMDMAVNDYCAAMVEGNPHLDQVLLYPRAAVKAASILGRARLEWAFYRACLARRYDVVMNLTEGERGALITGLSRAPIRLGFQPRSALARLPMYTQSLADIPVAHTVEKDLALLRLLGKEPITKQVALHWPDTVTDKIRAKLVSAGIEEPFVHVHPVARWLFKCWRPEAFAQVIDTLQRDFSLPVVITASPDPAELARVKEIIGYCQTRPQDWSGELTLPEVACVSSLARFFFGVDTAPMHMAAAVNTPVIALFGPSLPHIWGPWDNQGQQPYQNVRTTQRNGAHILLQHPDDALRMVHGQKISTALYRITPEEVLAAVEEVIARQSTSQ